jgi:hypothetical protein
MHMHTLFAGSGQALPREHYSGLPRKTARVEWPRVDLLSAWLFIAASTAIGGFFGFQLGSHYHTALGIIFAAAAVAGELTKPHAVQNLFAHLGAWRIGRAAAALVLAAMCVTYSLASDLALSSMIRGDLAAERQAKLEAIGDARAKKARAETELASLPVTKSPDEIEAAINTALTATKGLDGCAASWVANTALRSKCIEVEGLRGELAKARHRAELLADIEDASRALARATEAGTANVGQADPLAASVASYARALGWHWTSDAVSPWLALLLPLFIELGSTFGLLVASGTRSDAGVHEGAQVNAAVNTVDTSKIGAVATLREHLPTAVIPARSVDEAGERLLAALSTNGGTLKGSHRKLADLLGTKPATLHAASKALAEAGRVMVSTDNRGTVFALVAGGAVN